MNKQGNLTDQEFADYYHESFREVAEILSGGMGFNVGAPEGANLNNEEREIIAKQSPGSFSGAIISPDVMRRLILLIFNHEDHA